MELPDAIADPTIAVADLTPLPATTAKTKTAAIVDYKTPAVDIKIA
jgi:hypothetical protein